MSKSTRKERYAGYWNWSVALYKGDDLVDMGTIKELAERRGIRKDTIYYYLMPVHARRTSSNSIRAVRVDGDYDGA